ncbi:MAG: cation-translocating P-type ATPase [Thaumarchaeota archaeon]|jgi:Cd2+/Zn2+-exporting ATPase|nr:cation-translocating P-type ATPase [Candidatus Geocrenenecus arthurdayi]MCL7403859.1 cation-translocating P-type ATPase [Candidatus Geocrenenecus arthurdayi]
MDEEEHGQRLLRLWLTVVSGILLCAGLLSFPSDILAVFRGGLFGVSLALVGAPVLYNAIRRVRERPFNEDLLMGIAAVGATAIGVLEEGAAVLLLYSIAEIIEDYTVDKARNIAKSVAGLLPKRALLKKNGWLEEVPVEKLNPGDIIIVKAGWRIPIDGKIVAGRSNIDQSIITGESIPIEKSVGDKVFAGSLSIDGSIEVLTEKPYEESTVSRIVKMVVEAHERKAKIERFIDRFSRYYTPTMIMLSIGLGLFPPLALGQSFDMWFYRALIVLVIACPSALVISTPVTVLIALIRAMWSGILIKGGRYLEELGKIKAVIFDKTGTLTQGKLRVSKIISLNGFSEDEVLRLAAIAESKSSHPIANAIIDRAGHLHGGVAEVVDFMDIAGKGLKATLNNGSILLVGKISFLRELGVEIDDQTVLQLLSPSGTIVAVAVDGKLAGLIHIEDQIRPEAKDTIKELHFIGIKPVMLTGDNPATAKEASTIIGIEEYYANLNPEDKVRIVAELRSKYGGVAMVGDGVNDAPALAASNVGIAIGTAGNDVAIEAADIALMGSNLKSIPYLIKLGRKVSLKIKVNITLALSLKALMIILGALGFIPLWFAVIGDDGLTLLIIAYALPLLRFKPDYDLTRSF